MNALISTLYQQQVVESTFMPKLLFQFAFLCLTIHHSLLVMETIGPFTLVPLEKIDSIDDASLYPTKRYQDDQGHYVELIQSFPVRLNTNFFIEAKMEYKYDPYLAFENRKYSKINKSRLSLLMNSFLGDIQIKNRKSLPWYCTVRENSDKNNPTIIECYREHTRDNIPYKVFRFFSINHRLLGTYSTYFDEAAIGNDLNFIDYRHTIFLRQLSNVLKERVININKYFNIESIFLQDYFLIVGSYVPGPYDTDDKNKYHIDIYDAKKFATNPKALDQDDKNSDVPYYLSIDIEDKLTNKDIWKKYPTFKLVTITDDGYCILQNQITKAHVKIPFLHERRQELAPNLKVNELNKYTIEKLDISFSVTQSQIIQAKQTIIKEKENPIVPKKIPPVIPKKS